MNRDIYIYGMPNSLPEAEAAVARSRILRAVKELLAETRTEEIDILVSTKPKDQVRFSLNNLDLKKGKTGSDGLNADEYSIERRALQYVSQKPLYSFEQLVLPEKVKEKILLTLDAISLEDTVFEEWGLRKIQIKPRTVLNFYGLPGTGKTLAAHSIAERLNKDILLASYADIESKFHGDGPKNLKAIFYAAERDKSLLFLDEADSLLSKRLVEVNSGSEQAINSMRSQLLICIEQFRGVVIFATNLIENYDRAFETRMRHIKFYLPDFECRKEIWRRHLPETLPLAMNINEIIQELAKVDDVCGRDIREAVIYAASQAALRAKKQGMPPSKGVLTLIDLISAIEHRKTERIDQGKRRLSPEAESKAKEFIQEAIQKI